MVLKKIDKIIGIDLGTTNSCVSIMENNHPIIIPNEHNKNTTPSLVAVKKEKFIVGEDALKEDPFKIISASKRLIGRSYDDKEIQKYIKSLPYRTYSHVNGDIWIKVEDKLLSPVEVGAKILEKMKEIAQKYLKEDVKKSVITVPAHFNDAQRQATKDAGKIAGLEVVRVLNEPTAAALAYGLDRAAEGNVAVYDLGGGTFDVSILRLNNGIFEVLSTGGNTFLGGEDIDGLLADHLIQKYNLKTDDKSELKIEAEKAKIRLSDVEETLIKFKNKNIIVTKQELENLAGEFLKTTIEPCKKALRDANLTTSDIKHVVLVGGMTKMPLVRSLAREIFEKEPIYGVDPDEVVARGAAIQAGILSGNVDDVLLLDVSSLSIGIETVGGIFCPIIKRNMTLPTRETQFFTTSEDNQTEILINVYQGERSLVRDNKLLAKLVLKDIPSAPRAVPRIEVTFEADANGMYVVTAKDAHTGKFQSIEIVPAQGLTKKEIDRIIDEAEQKRKTDKIELKETEQKLKIKELIRFYRKQENEEKAEKLEMLLNRKLSCKELSDEVDKILKDK